MGEATGGMVTAPDPRAAHAGALMLRAGGSAVDAAVATAFAIGVVEPYMSGLGGGAWLVIRRPGARSATTVSGPIRAPGLARPDMFRLAPGADPTGLYGWPAVAGDANILGPLSVGTPGAVAALCRAHARFGLLPLAEVLAPAIELAEEGHQTNWFASSAICGEARNLRRFPESAALFLPGGLPLRGPSQGPGDRLVQPRLAAVLREIADGGAERFYRGRAGRAVAAFVEARGGTLRADDLATCEATETEIDPVEIGPLSLYGPPATGVVTAAEALQIVEAAGRRGLDPGPRLWARALARAFDDRLREVSTENSGWERLAGAEHAERVVAEWDRPLPVTGGPARAGCTSHLSAVDGRGMTVALTQTVLDLFGSRLVEPETGIVLNDGMMYFDPRPGQVTSISPGAAGLSAVCPVIVGGPGGEAVLGASGGRRIISAVAQIIARWRDGATLQAAVEAPRLHAEGRTVWLDRRRESAAADLTAAGHDVQVVEEEPTTWHFARPGGVERRPGRGWAPGVDRMKPHGVGVQDSTPSLAAH
ncbi:gamma-glutamyltransferase family protein [Acrocarpospora catenulata]|uniref:gamma-glutamyltransferase family protein n=1 Tax=Acrocarpospora catenulata TaxID=2836182 RepID=UPI001BD9669A|nr:gamma-glutamyltransferase [Acrocarpospora catenulata]